MIKQIINGCPTKKEEKRNESNGEEIIKKRGNWMYFHDRLCIRYKEIICCLSCSKSISCVFTENRLKHNRNATHVQIQANFQNTQVQKNAFLKHTAKRHVFCKYKRGK